MNDGSLEHLWSTVMPTRWRAMRSMPHTGARNMAIDTTLLASAANRDEGVLRTYAWERPTISFGRHESARARFTADSVAQAGLDAVRRPTGGRALLHSTEVTYSVTMPLSDNAPWTAAYAAVNALVAAALQSLRVPAIVIANAAEAPLRPEGPVCFEQPSPGEIAVHGRKLVGSAVWRERGAYLQHGSILLEDHQFRLAEAMHTPVDVPRAAALADVLTPPPTVTEVADALERALQDALAVVGHASPCGDAPALDESTVGQHEAHYRDASWLWRR